MKIPKLLPVLFVLAAVCLGFAPRTARASVNFQFFYDSLDPYGDWVQVGDYGYCWRPSDVDDDWSPYSDGYWAYTDAGWTWVSYEDWGGITYHYGRWANVSGEGWCWVPGNEWGPAWVSWRNNDDYVGWAPLPPEARWEPSVGFSVWVDNSYDIGPGHYNFCHSYDFGAPFLRGCLIPRGQNVTIIQDTVNITNITYNNVNKVVYNGGPNYDAVNRRSRRPVPALKLVQRKGMDNDVLTQEGRKGGRGRSPLLRTAQQGNQLEVGAPDVDKPQDAQGLKPKKVGKVIDKEKVNKGWAAVKDPEERKRLKKTMQEQTANLTPETAPAKPMQVSDLQAVPEKADPNAPPRGVMAKGQGKGQGNGKNKDAASATVAAEKAGGRRETALPNDTAEKAQKERPGKNGQGTDSAVADEGRAGKNRGKGKTDGVGVPEPAVLDPATATANTEPDRANQKARAKERRDAVETRQDAEHAAVQARRREAQVEAERDQVERAAARARRQQEVTAAQENASRRENQRANALEERQRANALEERRQQSVENAVERRQQQVEIQRDQQRQQLGRDRQLEAQRQMQVERTQRHQQQRALEVQRGGQQQRQADAQRQIQVQRQQQQQAQGGGGGGGGGRGGKQQQGDEEKAKHKK